MDYPETPEAVALMLLTIILATTPPAAAPTNAPGTRVLDLYAECLAAVNGQRCCRHVH